MIMFTEAALEIVCNTDIDFVIFAAIKYIDVMHKIGTLINLI